MADINTPFEQQVFDLPQRQLIADVHHHSEAYHLGRIVELAEPIVHRRSLRIRTTRLKLICSDNAGLRPVVATAGSGYTSWPPGG